MENQLFKYSEVPADWALCFLDECPLKEQCQRWLAYSYAPKGTTIHSCVTPHALDKGKCRYYVKPEPIRVAYGFGDLFRQVRRDDYHVMKDELIDYFGSSTYYYRYRRGEYPLTPKQQPWMRQRTAKARSASDPSSPVPASYVPWQSLLPQMSGRL